MTIFYNSKISELNTFEHKKWPIYVVFVPMVNTLTITIFYSIEHQNFTLQHQSCKILTKIISEKRNGRTSDINLPWLLRFSKHIDFKNAFKTWLMFKSYKNIHTITA